MSDEPKLSWGQTPDDLSERWPKSAGGTPEQAAFLTHIYGDEMQVDMLLEMLRAYDITAMKKYEHHGALGKVVLGFSGTGVSLYVPESLLEDAKNLLEPVDETALDTEEIDC